MSVASQTRSWADETQRKMHGAAAGVAGVDPSEYDSRMAIIAETRLIGVSDEPL